MYVKFKELDKRDKRYVYAIVTPFALTILAAIYAYLEFSANGIMPPTLWYGTFLFAFFAFVLFWFISMTIYIWTL